jgi:hypothetical protein
VDIPAEAYALHPALNQKVKDHCFLTKASFADWGGACNTGDMWPALKAGRLGSMF